MTLPRTDLRSAFTALSRDFRLRSMSSLVSPGAGWRSPASQSRSADRNRSRSRNIRCGLQPVISILAKRLIGKRRRPAIWREPTAFWRRRGVACERKETRLLALPILRKTLEYRLSLVSCATPGSTSFRLGGRREVKTEWQLSTHCRH